MGDTALIITAVAGLISALTGATALIVAEIRRVHKIVNQQRTDMMNEIRALKDMIRSEGGDPESASLTAGLDGSTV